MDPTQMVKAAAATQAMAGLFQGVTAKREGDAQASLLNQEARVASQQANAEEEMQRRQARQFLATQAAAIGEAGTGYGGTNAKLREQSAVEAELEALNIRYGGAIRRTGLQAEASFAKQRGRAGLMAGGMAAGAALLSGAGEVNALKARELRRGY